MCLKLYGEFKSHGIESFKVVTYDFEGDGYGSLDQTKVVTLKAEASKFVIREFEAMAAMIITTES